VSPTFQVIVFALAILFSRAAYAQPDFLESTPPALVSPISLTYPPEAKAKRIEGKVTLSLRLDTNGVVREVRVERTDSELLNEAAIAAMRDARFSPAREGGKPVNAWYQQTLSFKLSASDTATTVTHLLKDTAPVPITPLSGLVKYPPDALAAGIEGSVTLQALIDSTGKIDSVIVLGVSVPIFETPAIAAMNAAKFSPAIENGVKVPALYQQTISFKLPVGHFACVAGIDSTITAAPEPLEQLPVIFSRTIKATTRSSVRVLVANNGVVMNALALDANLDPQDLATILQASYDLPFAPGMVRNVVGQMWTDITFTVMPLK
jgi:TonB family protein